MFLVIVLLTVMAIEKTATLLELLLEGKVAFIVTTNNKEKRETQQYSDNQIFIFILKRVITTRSTTRANTFHAFGSDDP